MLYNRYVRQIKRISQIDKNYFYEKEKTNMTTIKIKKELNYWKLELNRVNQSDAGKYLYIVGKIKNLQSRLNKSER